MITRLSDWVMHVFVVHTGIVHDRVQSRFDRIKVSVQHVTGPVSQPSGYLNILKRHCGCYPIAAIAWLSDVIPRKRLVTRTHDQSFLEPMRISAEVVHRPGVIKLFQLAQM